MTKPSDFDEMSDQLWDTELREMQDLWANYNYLYVEDPERADKLRRPRWGGFFWNLVQRLDGLGNHPLDLTPHGSARDGKAPEPDA